MITLIEALNYGCLQYVSRPLKSFHVLVGPNASGKTTFLDVVGFLQDLVSDGLQVALSNRTNNPDELFFRNKGDKFELAVEMQIPEDLRILLSKQELDTARYEVAIGFDETQKQFEFKAEKLLLKKTKKTKLVQRSLFPMRTEVPNSLLSPKYQPHNKLVINKVPGGNDNFYSETYRRSGKGWAPSFKLGTQKSALGNLIEDSKSFPVATWFRESLSIGVQKFVLNSHKIKSPSPPSRVAGFSTDGSNLPWVIGRLRQEDIERYRSWIAHLQTSLVDLQDIETIERPEDKHCYMIYKYAGNLNLPSWMVSDGTLRLTALTLPAYLANVQGIYLIEEPENGIHPKAVTTMYDSLTSVYAAQVLLTTHSPVVLNAAKMDDVLCFAKNDMGATDVVPGSEHPRLRKWQGEANLGTLLASGVLG